jgi:hypothetical protein
LKITLIHPPTVALRISGFADQEFEDFAANGVYRGNVDRRIIPPSLPSVAAVMELRLLREIDATTRA